MDTPNHVGSYAAQKQRVCDTDLQRPNVTNDFLAVDFFDIRIRECVSVLAYSRPESFTQLAKAVAQGNKSLENQILRHWGIRG